MNDEQLLEFSDQHLNYEIHSLCFAIELFAKQQWDPRNFLTLCARNLFLEGIVIHSRCLYEFLYFGQSNNPKRTDDTLAIHYFESSEAWESLRPKMPDHFKDFYERAGKEIVHLTYTRLGKTDIEKRWDFRLLVNDLLKTLQLFIESAASNKIHPSVKRDLVFWKNRIDPILNPHVGEASGTV